MTVPQRKILLSVVDREGQPVQGALVRFYVGNKLRTEGVSQEGRPLQFSIDASVEIVDVEVFYGATHEWAKVPMDSGQYQITIDVPASTPAGDSSKKRVGGEKDGKGSWLSSTVLAALITAAAAAVVGYWQWVYKPGTESAATKVVELRIAVTDDKSGIPGAYVQLSDGSHQMEDHTDGTGMTKIFSIPKAGAATVVVAVSAPGYISTNRNHDRPSIDETYTVPLARVERMGIGAEPTRVARGRDGPASGPGKVRVPAAVPSSSARERFARPVPPSAGEAPSAGLNAPEFVIWKVPAGSTLFAQAIAQLGNAPSNDYSADVHIVQPEGTAVDWRLGQGVVGRVALKEGGYGVSAKLTGGASGPVITLHAWVEAPDGSRPFDQRWTNSRASSEVRLTITIAVRK